MSEYTDTLGGNPCFVLEIRELNSRTLRLTLEEILGEEENF